MVSKRIWGFSLRVHSLSYIKKLILKKKVNFEKKSYGLREWGDVEKPAIEESVFEVICL